MSKKYRVLVAEDDDKLRYTINDYLSQSGFDVITADRGDSAFKIFLRDEDIDIVLLDGMLPGMDGFDILQSIREISSVPVIMISARESEESQLKGFRLGADNYITKPFLLSVLKEHINALLLRTKGKASIIEKGALKIDTAGRKVYLNGEAINTTPKEFDVLVYLAENERIVLDRDSILDKVWGMDYYGDFRTVDTIVKQLRKKLTADYPYIKSVYGVGYYFEVQGD